MKVFFDKRGNKVELSLTTNAFQQSVKHVLVICQYKGAWFLTNHKVRGLEFPGGKVEEGESLKEAACREVYEETGAILDEIVQIAEYRVTEENETFVKAVFWGKINEVSDSANYHETNGPVEVLGDILQLRFGNEYSFIMKDEVISVCIQYIKELNKKNSDK